MRLSHELFRSGGVPNPDRPVSLDGGADARGAVREGVARQVAWWSVVQVVLEVGLMG
jgi:hypothetical protein